MAKNEQPEQDGFLAVIDRKIAALKALADSYRAALSLGALGQPGEIDVAALGGSASRVDAPIDLPRGALLGKSLPAAVKLWLQSVRRKQTVKEIATALRDGGVETTADSFENVVTGALHRLKANGEVLRFNDGWGLAELYPPSLRVNLEKGSKPTKTTGTRTRAKRKAAKGRVSTRGRRKTSAEDNKAAAILFALPAEASASVTPNEIVAALKGRGIESTPDYVRLTLRRWLARGKVQKVDGKYFRPGRSSAA